MENNSTLFPLAKTTDFSVKVGTSSARKYPNVIWFPRSKTDPQEIREVLKQALKVQNDNPDSFFNDKLLGEYMAKIGSINVVGMKGKEYIEAYQGKSTGDISYITNARMLMRFFRFLGLVTRISKAKYKVTDLGKLYTQFSGDFPSTFNGQNEEQLLLQSLGDFSFYCVNDDSIYRDSSFQIRPFIWLLNTLSLEPQCIYQLIVTAFASKRESTEEVQRIRNILVGLRKGKTTLKEEFKRLGLDADDYSCVHNFYDSAKILVYLGMSLGLISKTVDPSYGKKIAGKAKHLKQASIFYTLTDKGKKYLSEKIQNKLIYYSDLYKVFNDKSVLQATFILASLNFALGTKRIISVSDHFFAGIFGKEWTTYLNELKDKLQIEIKFDDGWVSLITPISFNFFQSIPPEFANEKPLSTWYYRLMGEFIKEHPSLIKINITKVEEQFAGEVISRFIFDDERNISYEIPSLTISEAEQYIKYSDKDNVFGGQDRFASRISPTNSVILVGDKMHVDNDKDSLDLLIPLRRPDSELRQFINRNLSALVKNFLTKSDTWAKDQHYTWIRNCFRQFGCDAIYSGSSGMLSRADVSITSPFIGGIEAKSPSENRGSINTKAIRQALDAKVQVGAKYPEKRNLPRMGIAIGRRITPLAIEEEKKWRKEGQPVLLISDAVLYYLTLKTVDIEFTNEDVTDLFTKKFGLLDSTELKQFFSRLLEKKGIGKDVKTSIIAEIDTISNILDGMREGAVEG